MGTKETEEKKVAVELYEDELAAVILALACYEDKGEAQADELQDVARELRGRLKELSNANFDSRWALDPAEEWFNN